MNRDLFDQARAHHLAGRLDQARALFTDLQARALDDRAILHHLGQIAFQKGETEIALDFLQRAQAGDDGRAEIHADLGVVHHRMGNWEAAERHLRQAVELAPDDATMRYNLALLEGDLGRLDAARAGYGEAIRLDPGHAPAHNNLGNIAKRQKDHDGAIRAYRAAIEADEGYAPAHKNLADSLEAAGDAEGAAAAYRQAVRLRADGGTRIRDSLLLPVIADSTEQILEWRARMAEHLAALADEGISLVDPVREVGATNFALAYHGLDDRALQESLARLYLAACPALGFVAPHCREDPRQQCERPRIGFVSSFFRAHTIGRLFGRLIAGLPGQGFDVRVFSFNPQEDALSGSLAEAVDEFIPLAPDLEAARQRIAEARLDILYFCDLGMEPLTYFLAFSRLAPIQCVSWGHPVTTGIPSLDYFLSSHLTEPEGAGEAYSERLVRLRGFPVCVEAPPRAERARRRANLYICPQSLFKFHPDFDRLIGQVLRLDPKGELLVLEGSHPRWREILGRRWRRTLPGVAERIKFIPRMAREDYLNALAGASVMLDTPHFCGGMTSLEGLANRLPVVTLPGRFLRGRVTAGFLEALDLGECIAESEEEYAETAVRLAGAEGAAKKLRGQISDRAPSLFNNPRDLDENARFFRWALAGGQGSFP